MPVKEGIEVGEEIEIYDKDNDIYFGTNKNISRFNYIIGRHIFTKERDKRIL